MWPWAGVSGKSGKVWKSDGTAFHLFSMFGFVWRKTGKKLFGQQADARYCCEKEGIAHLLKSSHFNSRPPIAVFDLTHRSVKNSAAKHFRNLCS